MRNHFRKCFVVKEIKNVRSFNLKKQIKNKRT